MQRRPVGLEEITTTARAMQLAPWSTVGMPIGTDIAQPHPALIAIVSGSIFAWRWSFQMQAVNVGDHFSFRGPATEIEAEHLIRALGRCPSDPQADQQTGNKGGIDLDTHPM